MRAVIGLGAIGQLAVQLLVANGCRVLGADLDPGRVKQALDLGASWSLAPGTDPAGWIGSAIDPTFERAQENRAALRERIAAPCLGILEHRPQASPAELAAQINVDFVVRQQTGVKGRAPR